MKINIITLHRVFNYGSVFQAYATQKVIQNLGHDVKIIDYITEQRTIKRILFSFPENIKSGTVKRWLYLFGKTFSILIKLSTFNSFINKNIKLTKRYITYNDLQNEPPIADIYVTGSDQVWNSKYNEGIDKGFFLDFTPESTKKIAFVSSFGNTKLDYCEFEETKLLLSKYDALSVREDSANLILEGLGRKDGICLIDPTLQISKQDWRQISSKPLVKEKYLLLMLLYNEDNHATEYAQQIAKQKGLKVVKISWDLFKPKGIDILMTHRRPQDFLSLFDNAEFIVTNSFHGLAFSINFNKQFVIIPRNEFNSRIESLLRLVHLDDRFLINGLDWDVVNKSIAYDEINDILDNEREKAKDFLKENLC